MIKHLPPELWILIICHVDDKFSFARLCLTSKSLQTLTEKILYKRVEFVNSANLGCSALGEGRSSVRRTWPVHHGHRDCTSYLGGAVILWDDYVRRMIRFCRTVESTSRLALHVRAFCFTVPGRRILIPGSGRDMLSWIHGALIKLKNIRELCINSCYRPSARNFDRNLLLSIPSSCQFQLDYFSASGCDAKQLQSFLKTQTEITQFRCQFRDGSQLYEQLTLVPPKTTDLVLDDKILTCYSGTAPVTRLMVRITADTLNDIFDNISLFADTLKILIVDLLDEMHFQVIPAILGNISKSLLNLRALAVRRRGRLYMMYSDWMDEMIHQVNELQLEVLCYDDCPRICGGWCYDNRIAPPEAMANTLLFHCPALQLFRWSGMHYRRSNYRMFFRRDLDENKRRELCTVDEAVRERLGDWAE